MTFTLNSAEPGDILRLVPKLDFLEPQNKYILAIYCKNDGFYWVACDDKGKIREPVHVVHSNCFAGYEIDKHAHIELTQKTFSEKNWYLTGNEYVDVLQMPTLDGRFEVFSNFAPQSMRDVYLQSDDDFGYKNGQIVNEFVDRMILDLEKLFEHYRASGYTFEKDFPNEYRFFLNPETGQKARVGYNGHVEEYR